MYFYRTYESDAKNLLPTAANLSLRLSCSQTNKNSFFSKKFLGPQPIRIQFVLKNCQAFPKGHVSFIPKSLFIFYFENLLYFKVKSAN